MNTKANKEKQPSAATNMMLEKRRLLEKAEEYERRLEALREDYEAKLIDIDTYENTRSAYVLKIESCKRRAKAMKATLRDN